MRHRFAQKSTNLEIRNSKQIRIGKFQIQDTSRFIAIWSLPILVLVSCFEIRISDLLGKGNASWFIILAAAISSARQILKRARQTFVKAPRQAPRYKSFVKFFGATA
jgi:hypothetical protein